MPKRNNLWYSLLFIFLGGFLLRQSFFVENKALAIVALAIGVVFMISAAIVFWKNFRE
jgi:hypothetical protein